MKTKSIICCMIAFAFALVSCKKGPASEKPAELELTPDLTEEYAGGKIMVFSNNNLKETRVTDNLAITYYALTCETPGSKVIKIYPGSGYMRTDGVNVESDSAITVTATDEYGQTKTLELKGKSWYFKATKLNENGTSIMMGTIYSNECIYVSLYDSDSNSLKHKPGFQIWYNSDAYELMEDDPAKNDIVLKVKDISNWKLEDYTIKANYVNRVEELTPKAFQYVG